MLPGKAGNERGILATLGVLRLVILLRADSGQRQAANSAGPVADFHGRMITFPFRRHFARYLKVPKVTTRSETVTEIATLCPTSNHSVF